MANNKNFVVKNGLDVGLDITANNVTANTFIGTLSGNANTATALATPRTISLGGDLSGSASFDGTSNITITTTVADDSHNHVISNVDGLQTALDGKLDSSDIGTTVLAYDANLQSFVTAFTLPTVDGTSGQVLTTNGAGVVTFADAGGGTALELYAENPSSPIAPSATGTNAVAIGSDADATATDSISIGNRSNASADAASALGVSADATKLNASALGTDAWANGTGSITIGKGYSSGTDSFTAAIDTFSTSYGSSGTNSIAIGQLARATNTNSIAIGDTALSTTANLIALGGTTDTVQISGAYTLPTTDGTAGQVLTTNGAGVVTFADAGGGTALELYAENPSSPTAPSATGTNAVAIGSNTEATGDRSMALIEGANATNLRAFAVGFNTTASGANSIAMGPNTVASGNQSIAIGSLADATSSYSLALGYTAQAVTGLYATALTNSHASGTDSLAAAIGNNSSSYGATGANSVAIGYQAKATTGNSLAIGQSVISSASHSFVAGRNNTVSATGATAFGTFNTASGSNSFVVGSDSIATQDGTIATGFYASATIRHKKAHASGRFVSAGDAQTGTLVLRSDTTDATPESLTTINSAPFTDNQVILPNNSAYAFHGTIVARQQASQGTACAAWRVEGLIRREGSAGTTVLVNSATTVLDNTPAWGMTLSADTTNGGLAITVTGAAATNIRWVATINTSEVTY